MSSKVERRIWVVVLFWSFVAVLLAFLFSIAASAVLLQETIGQGSAQYLSWGIMLLSVFLSALCGSKSVIRERRFLTALSIGIAFYLYTVIVKLLAFPGTIQNVWVNLLISLAAAAVAFTCSVGKKKRAYTRKKR